MRLPGQDDAAPTGLGWLLLTAAASLPWLLAPLGQPWPALHAEALAALVWLAAALVWQLRDRRGPVLPGFAWALAMLALWPLLQVASGQLENLSQAVLPAAFIAAAALAVVAGASLPLHRLLDALFGACLLASLVSTGLALAQWLQVDLGILTPQLAPGQRPVGNLGQPNNLAALLLWGLAALWWAWDRRRVGAAVATLAAAWMGLGLLLTQSRSGVLGLVLLCTLAALRPADRQRPVHRAWLVAALLLFAGLSIGWLWLGDGDAVHSARSLAESSSAGKRPAIWSLMLAAVAQQPWFGHGFGQTVQAHIAVAGSEPPLQVLVSYAHNLPLDLAVWAGAPVALLSTTVLLAWAGHRAWRCRGDSMRIPLAAVFVFLLHAMLELPHAYLYFLMPAGLFVGAVEQQLAGSARRPSARWPLALLLGAGLLLSLQFVREYAAVQADLQAWRFRAARIGQMAEPAPPRLWLLNDLQRNLVGIRIRPEAGMAPEALDELLRAARRWPGDVALFRSAQALALNHRPLEAERQMTLLCALHRQASCSQAKAAWQAWKAQPDAAR